MPYSGPAQHKSITVAQSSVTGESKPIKIATSQSAQCLSSLSSLPLPRPFAPQNYDKNRSDSFPPPPLPDSLPSTVANLGLKTPSAYLPLPRHVGYVDARIVADQQAHDVSSSTAYNFKHGVQYSTELPGKDVAETLGDISAPVTGENKKEYVNVPFPTYISVEKPSHTLTHASDGAFVSEQQAHEIAFSTQMPVGLVSQHSKSLDIAREVYNQSTGNKHVSPFCSSDAVTGVPGENKQNERVGVVTASIHPAGVSFSTETKAKNSQTGELPSNLLHGKGTLIQDECISLIPNNGIDAYSSQGPSDKAEFPCFQQGGISGMNFLQDRDLSAEQYPYNVAHSSACPGQKSSLHSFPISNDVRTVPNDSSLSQYPNVPRFSQVGDSCVISQDAMFLPCSKNVLEQVVHSVPIAGDSMPKSAHVMQQGHLADQEGPESETVEHELTGKLEHLTGINTFNFECNIYCHWFIVLTVRKLFDN